ncbi:MULTISPECIES: MFS transporter [unclassified Bradyrhizobium]|uniref:MFS transporter n=1 Tax=unclassified Bradyrhizobium TaxID=2631580 RepID=UPI00247A8103|nr:MULTISPECIES: MFS transporter [unclassified Bradyrhizobium]WGR74002.1 MFS transporter [Bradyrhizobium sp. ISRA426]WGR78839.1 MFS transporter [Bradyrhizobium sp. ISRA430]WGR89241.1 MFS transporter [Bradyrhizobium sp. ISRA432]
MARVGNTSIPSSARWEFGKSATVVAVACMIGALFAGSTIATPLYVIYKQQFGFSQITLTLIYAVYVVGNLTALLVFGRISDEIGRRRAAAIAMGIAIVGALVFLLARGVASLYVARVLSGLAIGIGAGTGTAWLAELIAEQDRSRATVIATVANFTGLGLGALVAGLLAEYVALPLRIPFVAYLATLVVVAALLAFARETVERPLGTFARVSIRPRASVPSSIRSRFVAPAVTGFGAMALVAFFAALAPSVLANELHEASHAVAGAIFLELAAAVALVIALTRSLSSRTAMLWSLGLMLPSLALLVIAQFMESLGIMIAATAICGVAAGLGYRGSLQVVNQIAPDDRRAEVVSAYFICCFLGNALPVIGIGILSTLISSTVASLVFAVTIAVFAVVALAFGLKYQVE